MPDRKNSVVVKIRRIGDENHMAARENTVYAEDLNGRSVNVAFAGSTEKFPDAVETDDDVDDFDDWVIVEITEGEGSAVWYARPVDNTDRYSSGDTPAESALNEYYGARSGSL